MMDNMGAGCASAFSSGGEKCVGGGMLTGRGA